VKKLPVMKLIRDKEVIYLFCPQFQSCDDITKFGLFVFDCYIANFIKLGFVISGFFSIHFTVTLSGLKDIICCIGDFVNPFTPRVSYGGVKVILTSESVDEILWCDYSNETSPAVLSHGTIFVKVFFKMKFEICLEF